jgi:hypothetical protein
MSFLSVILWVLAGVFVLLVASGALFDAFFDPLVSPDSEPKHPAPLSQSPPDRGVSFDLRWYLTIQALLTLFSVVAGVALGGVTDLWSFALAVALSVLIPSLILGAVSGAWLAGRSVGRLLRRRKRCA